MSTSHTLLVAAVASLLTGVAVAGAQSGPGDTSVSVSPPVLLSNPARSPADFGGVSAVRRGKPIPKGYVAVGHRVTVTAGSRKVYPAFTIACPRGKTLRTFANMPGSKVVVQIVGPSPIVRERAFDYVGKPRWAVLGDYQLDGKAPGTTFSGMIYGLCR